MRSDAWARAKEILGVLLRAPKEERAEVIQKECGDDDDLRLEVEKLLRHSQVAADFLEYPAHLYDFDGSIVVGDARTENLVGSENTPGADRFEATYNRAFSAYSRRDVEGYRVARRFLLRLLDDDDLEKGTLRGRALHLLASVSLREWDLRAARRYLDEAIDNLQDDGARPYLAQAYDTFGQLHETLGEHQRAVSHYVSSLAMKARSNDRFGLAVTLNNLGRLQLKHEEWRAARRLFMERLDIAKELADEVGIVFSGGLLAVAMARAGDVDRAADVVRATIDRARDSNMGFHLALALKSQAEVEILRGDPRSAIQSASEGLQVPEAAGPSPIHAYLRRVRGDAYYALGQLDEAGMDLTQAAEALRRGEDSAEEMMALEGLAHVCHDRQRKEEALRAIDRALFLSRRQGLTVRAARLARQRERILLLPGVIDLDLDIEWGTHPLTLTVGKVSKEGPKLELRILKEIDRGGFGIVYHVEDRASGEEYALKKLILDDRGSIDQRIQRFRAEAFAAGRVVHPGVVRVFYIANDAEGTPYLLMELLTGGTLKDRHLGWQEAFRVGAELAGALAVVHAEGIVHRDIKPGNILFRTDDQPVLTDFGIAHLPGSIVTMTGHFLGSIQYSAPEALSVERAGPAADVFSLGVCIYESLDGGRPYEIDRGEQGWYQLAAGPPRAPRAPGMPSAARQALLAMIDREAKRRPTAREAQRLLEEYRSWRDP